MNGGFLLWLHKWFGYRPLTRRVWNGKSVYFLKWSKILREFDKLARKKEAGK